MRRHLPLPVWCVMISLPHLALLVSFSFSFTWVKRKVWLLGLVLLLSLTQVLFPIPV